MPSVTTNGQVTIPKAIRESMGINPGDEVVFEQTDKGYVLQKEAPTTNEGTDPFEKYRGIADSEELRSSGSRTQSGDSGATMPERMRRVRGESPRKVNGEESKRTDAGEQ